MALHPGEQKSHLPVEAPAAWDPIRRALEENKDWCRDLVEHSCDLLCVHDLEGRFLSVNPVPARLLGYSVEEMMQKSMREFVDPQFRGQFDVYLREIERTGESRGLLAVMTRSGEQRIWEYHNTLRTEGVEAPIVRGMAHDVTERVRAEKALRATNEQLVKTAREREQVVCELTLFRTLLDQSNDAIHVVDLETRRFLDVNERACLELGYSREELLSMTVYDIDADFDESSLAQMEQQVQESGFAIMERVHRRKNGTTFPVEMNLRKVRVDREYCVAMSRDITARKLTEERLREFERVVENLEDMILVVNRDYRYVIVNPAFLRYWGMAKEQVVGRLVAEVMNPKNPKVFETVVKEKLDECFLGKVVSYELRNQYPGMGERDVSITYLPVENSAGIDRVACVLRDITERKQAERALRESEARERARAKELETVLDVIPIPVIIAHDAQCLHMTANRMGREYLRLRPGANASMSAPASEKPRLRFLRDGVEIPADQLPIQRAAATGLPMYEVPTTIMFEDGTERHELCSVVPLLGEDEKVRGAIAATVDLTDRIRAEAELRQREAELQEAQRVAHMGSWQLDLKTQAVTWSEQIYRELGLDPRSLTPSFSGLNQLLTPEGWQRAVAAVERVTRSRQPEEIEVEFHHADGRTGWALVRGDTDCDETGNVVGLHGIALDITQRKHAEDALRASEERLRLAQEVAKIGTFERDLQTGESRWSPEMEAMYGLAPGEFPKSIEAFLELVHVEDRPSVARLVEQSMEAGNVEGEWRVVWRDGTMHWIAGRWRVFKDEDGRPVRILGMDFDITARKQAEEALRESEERFRSIVSAMAEGVLLRDADGRILACNRSFEQMLGVTSEQMVGTTAAEWEHRTIHEDGSPFPGEDHPAMVALRTGRPQSDIRMGFRRQDGGLTWISINAQPIFRSGESEPHAVVTSFTDITERKKAEEAITTLVQQVRADSSENFFTSMAIQLAKCLETDCALIGEFIEGQENNVQTIAVCIHGAIVDNFTYDLACTQCARITLQGECSHACAVQEIFPRDILLKEMRVESCVGTPLCDSKGRAIGIMMAAHTRPLANARFAEMILQLFSTRTAAEIERKRTEEALRQSEERFRVALKNSPIAVFNQDRDLRYTWMYNSQLALPASRTLGKTLGELFDPEEAARITVVRRRVLETGVGARHEVQIIDGGRKHYFDTTIEPVLDSAGAVIGLTGASTDVTALREASEALREAKKKLTEEKLYLEQEIDTELGFGEIIGQSKALQAVIEKVGKVAASDATVLLLGETGTGKELVARAIHRLSQRANSSLIKLNCAAIPSGLLESELFGNEKGAFTGAVSRKIGRLELSDKGTLFLDEIGEISLALQPKLLRVLQDQEFERLGGIHTLKVDFRLIAATNRDLADSVRENEFRSDLYYRLNVFPIRVPPLRERREDIPLLVEYFVQKCGRRMNRSITSIPKKTMDALMGWEWPGNVRELENFIERSVILTQGSVLVSPLSELRPFSAEEKSADESLEAAEREHILRALRESHGQIGGLRGAAMRLGLKRTTLQSKLKHLGINPRYGSQ